MLKRSSGSEKWNCDRICAKMPPDERKSGIPAEVEIPAPVRIRMLEEDPRRETASSRVAYWCSRRRTFLAGISWGEAERRVEESMRTPRKALSLSTGIAILCRQGEK